jgi:hypothetical protein
VPVHLCVCVGGGVAWLNDDPCANMSRTALHTHVGVHIQPSKMSGVHMIDSTREVGW